MDEKKLLDNLKKLIEDDKDGLLDIKEKASNIVSKDDRLVNGFNEINLFFQNNNRKPSEFSDNPDEQKLYYMLEGILDDKKKINILKEHDIYNILSKKEILLENDIFADPLLSYDNSSDIFNLKHVKDIKEREEAEFIAKRKKCNNFAKYENLFKNCHEELKTEERTLSTWVVGTVMEVGDFYLHKGILAYISDRSGIYIDKWNRKEARLKIIFENGTESNMLMRSFGKILNADNGKVVTKKSYNLLTNYKNNEQSIYSILEEDQKSGYIYILKSLSENLDIKNIDNLYKIGYSEEKVQDRIKNAEKDPTYLMAPVKIIQTYQCYNLNPQKLESLLHRVLDNVRLKLDIFDDNGERYLPKEWFVAPLDIIDEIVNRIIDGSIVYYNYDSQSEILIKK